VEAHVPNPKNVPDPAVDEAKQTLGLIEESVFAALRGVKLSALWNERSLGKGPAFERWGRKIYYSREAIEKYRVACTVKPTRAPTLIDGPSSRRRQRRSATT
jgi:hypothetical protein